eukprot:322320_1
MGWWITSFIGMVMILLAEYLYNLFKTKSIKQIIYLCNKIQVHQFRINSLNIIHIPRDYTLMIQKLSQYSKMDFISVGMKSLNGIFNKVCKEINIKNVSMNVACQGNGFNYHEIFWIKAKVAQCYEHNIAKAVIYYSIAAFSTTDMYLRIISLISLSDVCQMKSDMQCLIALKTLKIAFKLSTDANIMPVFVNTKYKMRKRKLKRVRGRLKCNYCGIGYISKRLRSCKGCMKAHYCSVLCQKLDWKKLHKKNCDGSWRTTYPALIVIASFDMDKLIKKYDFACCMDLIFLHMDLFFI